MGGGLGPCLPSFSNPSSLLQGASPSCQRHVWQIALGWLHQMVNRQEFSCYRETSFHPGVPDSVTPNSKVQPPWERFDPENSQIILASVRVQGGYRCCPGHWWELGDGPQVEAPLTYSPTSGAGPEAGLGKPREVPASRPLCPGSLVHVTSAWTVSLCTVLPKPP